MKLKKKFQLLWTVATREVLVDYESDNPRTVTECTRAGVSGADFDTKDAKDARIAAEGLTDPHEDNDEQ